MLKQQTIELICINLELFAQPDVVIKKEKADQEAAQPDETNYDEDEYPEKYRKTETIKGSNLDTPEPFCIGYVTGISCAGIVSKKMSADDVRLRLVKLYRPGNTHFGVEGAFRGDWNLVYWSSEIVTVELSRAVSKCVLVCSTAIDEPIEEFVRKGPNRFYFNKTYNAATKSFEELPPEAESVGVVRRSKSKKLLSDKQPDEQKKPQYEEWLTVEPLKTLDIFAGCGGLSEGLHQVNIFEIFVLIFLFKVNVFRSLNSPEWPKRYGPSNANHPQHKHSG